MKIYVSLSEFIFKAIILCIITTVLRGYIGPVVYYYVMRIFQVIYVLYLLYLISLIRNKNKLPGKSYNNFFGFIELHIDKSNNGSRKKFYATCADTILVAHELKKDVLFDTWLIEPKELKDRLGDSVEVRKCPIIIRIIFMFLKAYYLLSIKESYKKKMYRYIVHIDRLNTSHMLYLKKMSSKKERVID